MNTTFRHGRFSKADSGSADLAERVRQRRRRRRQRMGRMATSFAPMIDMTFLLLIFFLVTTTFERAEGILASKMPRDPGGTAAATPLPLSPIVIHLTSADPAEGGYHLSLEGFSETPRDFSELADSLRRIQDLPGFDRKTPVVILADAGVWWDYVVGCWNAALAAGCQQIAFGAQPNP